MIEGRVGEGSVGDERLRPVQDEFVALAARGGTHAAKGVRPGAGLRDRPGADLFQGKDVGDPALFLLDRSLREGRTASRIISWDSLHSIVEVSFRTKVE
jgi:hypothetical protein